MPSMWSLGFKSYHGYLKSPLWKAFRDRYHGDASTKKKCEVCGRTQIQLHHTTYARLGEERFSDVMPLCQKHHREVHEWLEDNNLPVERSAEAVRSVRFEFKRKKRSSVGERQTESEWENAMSDRWQVLHERLREAQKSIGKKSGTPSWELEADPLAKIALLTAAVVESEKIASYTSCLPDNSDDPNVITPMLPPLFPVGKRRERTIEPRLG